MTDKQALIAAFARFLETEPEPETAAEVGLVQLFTELAALRTEVRAESRQFSRTLEEYRRVLDLVEREQQGYEDRLRHYERSRLKPLLLDLADLRDRLAAGVAALESLRPNWLVRRLSSRRRLRFEAVRSGQGLTLERFDGLLAALGVEPVRAQGGSFDPAVMRAAEVVHLPDHADGEVIGEVRRGWRWRDEVLRPAEVKVNKRKSPT